MIHFMVVKGSDSEVSKVDMGLDVDMLVNISQPLKPVTGPFAACSMDIKESSCDFQKEFLDKLAEFAKNMINAIGDQEKTEMACKSILIIRIRKV